MMLVFCPLRPRGLTKFSKRGFALLKSDPQIAWSLFHLMKAISSHLSLVLFSLIIGAAGFAGWSCSKPVVEKRSEQRIDSLLQERRDKDEAFKGESSPFSSAKRAEFKGLSYYPEDPQFRFSLPLRRHPQPTALKIATNTGEMRGALRYGEFEFQVNGQPCVLQAYRMEDMQAQGAVLFIPFRDATSGKETYGSGRYIELKENTSGIYTLDFNRAYNPFCAYNSEYSCPIPPSENIIKVGIEAGEKVYKSHP